MPQLTIEWTKLQLFTIDNIKNVPDEAGIYRLSYKSADGNIYVFFIGDASALRTALNDIQSKNTNNECIKTFLTNLQCYFKYALVPDEANRKNCVRTLYTHFSPKCNLTLPDGNIIEVNTT